MAESYVVGVDTGGTFTDIVALSESGAVHSAKAPTTPHDFSLGVMDAVETLAASMGVALPALLGSTTAIMHGSTVATNALITRSGSRVGLITTRGFEDTPFIMRAIGRVDGLPESEVRHVTNVTKPSHVLPRSAVMGVAERVDAHGQVVYDLDEHEARGIVGRLLREERIEGLAVSLLNAWTNPVHERMVAALASEFDGDTDVYVTAGHELSRVAGEYARTNTAILNAYVGPVVTRYLQGLERKLRAQGFAGTFLIMQGNGGAAHPQQCAPIANLQSGPAAGMLAAGRLADNLGHEHVITADMGGTSFDVGLLISGVWAYAEEPIFERFRIMQPLIDVQSIGAGGGTIARVDQLTKRLIVGPQSAGADPGPVCYDTGGEEPTVTDADVVLGFIDPEFFLGGRRPLNAHKAETAVRERLAGQLGTSTLDAAASVFEIVNNKMADLMRAQIVRSGELPDDFVLYAFGGAGPVHAAFCARELGVRQVYVSTGSSTFSALGAAMADVIQSHLATMTLPLPDAVRELSNAVQDGEHALGRALSEGEGVGEQAITYQRFASLRYQRQTTDVEVPLPEGPINRESVKELLSSFEREYEERYGAGSGYRSVGVELSRLRIDAVGRMDRPGVATRAGQGEDPSAALKGSRQMYLRAEGAVRASVYDYDRLAPGNVLHGPAIIETTLTTVVVPPQATAVIDAYRSIRIDLL